MTSYPLPNYAISVWIAGDSLMVAFPGTVSEQGHTIKLPASQAGLKTALDIAKARSEAHSLLLGNKGTPTQWEADKMAAWGKAMQRDKEERIAEIERKREATAAERREADEFLKELGL